jgi:hypothetical protein
MGLGSENCTMAVIISGLLNGQLTRKRTFATATGMQGTIVFRVCDIGLSVLC